MQLGIDIGTHTARAAYLDSNGKPRLAQFASGKTYLPAAARQTMRGLEIGEGAAQALAGNAETTLYGCTRLMGRASHLPAQLLERLPYSLRIVDGEAVCNLLYAEVYASEVYGQIVQRVASEASQAVGQPIEGVVLTVPASAEDRFRVQARAAVERLGIPVLRLINQPAATLLAAQLPKRARRVAVVHCGEGSTEVSLAECNDKGIHILTTAGDIFLGGDDFAWAVAAQLNERFQQTAGVDVFGVGDSKIAAVGLRNAAEDALRRLSHVHKTTLVLDHGAGFGRDLVTEIHRQEVDRWLAPLMARAAALCNQALFNSRLQAAQVDAVLLAGDWADLPALQEQAAAAFGKPAAALYLRDAALLPVYGAALITAEESRLVWDVTPYALGINCYYGDIELFSPIIWPNTPIPTPDASKPGAFTERYQTRYPDQRSVTLDVLQYRGARNPNPYGQQRVCPNECELLGSWAFSGLGPKKGRHAAFTVTFAVDINGILHLYAKETATGHSLVAHVDRAIG
jgi:molecular chaperone DnaK